MGLRCGVALLMAAVGLSFACAAVMVVAHWRPQGLTTHDTYNTAFAWHGAPALVALPLLVLFFAELGQAPPRWRPSWLLPAAWAGLGLEALLVAATLVLGDEGSRVWSRWAGLPLLPITGLIAALVLPRLRRPLRARDLALAFAAVVQLVSVGLIWPLKLARVLDSYEHATFFAVGRAFSEALIDAIALAGVATALSKRRDERGPLIAVAVSAVAAIVPRESLLLLPASLAAILAAGWLLVSALRHRESTRSRGEALFTALATLTFFEAASFGQLLRSLGLDTHLHDTYFAVGVLHLQVTTCLLAAVAVAHRHGPEVKRQSLVWMAAALSAIGSQVMGFTMLVLGSRGMPRHYFNYLPEFQAWHRAVAVGGGLLMFGLGLACFAIIKARRQNASL